MTGRNEPVRGLPVARLRLGSGVEILERWAAGTDQAAKNAMYKALFAISDGSVFHSHEVVDHHARPTQFTVKVKHDLVVRVCVHDSGVFGISFIGRAENQAEN
jgi:hypothetical protein